MAQTQISDVVVPAEFTDYQIEQSLIYTALFQSGVAVPNGEMTSQLQAGAQQFTVPFWADAGETEADITSDNPALLSTPLKIGTSKIELASLTTRLESVRQALHTPTAQSPRPGDCCRS